MRKRRGDVAPGSHELRRGDLHPSSRSVRDRHDRPRSVRRGDLRAGRAPPRRAEGRALRANGRRAPGRSGRRSPARRGTRGARRARGRRGTAGADDRRRLLWARDAMLAAAHNATLENAADPEIYDAVVHRAARARCEFLRVVGELRRRLSAVDLGAMLDQPPAAIDELMDPANGRAAGRERHVYVPARAHGAGVEGRVRHARRRNAMKPL